MYAIVSPDVTIGFISHKKTGVKVCMNKLDSLTAYTAQQKSIH